MITVMPIIIVVLVFLEILLIAKTYHPEEKVIRIYEKVNNQLQESKGSIFNYDRINDSLIANGAPFHYGKWINPINYYGIRLVVAALLFYIGIRFHGLLAFICAVVGFQLPHFLLWYLNRRDNDLMIRQLLTLYNALYVQIQAGVFVTNAMTECYTRLPYGRLRTALEELASELLVNNAFDEAVTHFNKKFNNRSISMLCVLLHQCKETGQSIELLQDMSEQMKDINSEVLKKRKRSLDRIATGCILGVLAVGFTVIIAALVMDIYKAGIQL